MTDIRHLIGTNETIRNALSRLNSLSGDEMTLFAVNNLEDLLVEGTLTNGDIRRALLAGVSLDDTVDKAMYRNFMRIEAEKADRVDDLQQIRSKGITLVPVVDAAGRLTDIVDLNRQPTSLPLKAILMAGGRGERLRPLTLTTPKPLLAVDGKAIIDYNVEALARVGITDITVTTRYLADQIYAHFEQPVAGVKVRCVTESTPLGTIGAASLIHHDPDGNTLVMNSDLLTTVSFEDMYLKHRDSKAAVTVGVIPYQVSVPYAILSTADDTVTGIEEKPSYSYYANGGIYIFSNDLLASLPKNARTDATDLITRAIETGRRVVYHVINGTWIDIGSPTDFGHAQDLMRHHRNLSMK